MTPRSRHRLSVLIGLGAAVVFFSFASAQQTPPLETWGSVQGVTLTAPFSDMETRELLDISLGAMPRDLVRDGLPWFGAVRDDFLGKPRSHRGLDFYGEGMEIRAMADGRIIANSTTKTAGYYVKIDHGSGVKTIYIHLDEPYDGPDTIKRGDVLGITGTSGNAVSPQLHLGVSVDDVYIDPIDILYESSGEEARETIDYYRSLMSAKEAARDRLVAAFLSDDETTRTAEYEEALFILSIIAHDRNISLWLENADPPTDR
ncbi:MAG: M23 family metallopeptidase [Deltaproteobacteria bacterium]|nr:M23 family metallopeptidase [Candidatus Zymogenaceae bacterium]